MRKGIPQKTRTLPNLEAFLIENLRGPAIKLGDPVILGHDHLVEVVASRVKYARLYAKTWQTRKFIEGATVTRPPVLPENIEVNPREPLKTVGALVLFAAMPAGVGLDYAPDARIMGDIKYVKPVLKGHKFHILSRCGDFLCVQLADS